MSRSLPRRPLLKPWYRLAYDGDRLVLEHGQVVSTLRGRAVRRLLPALLPMLDGTRSLEEIEAHLGAAAAPAIRNAIEVLAACGLVCEGPPLRRALAPVAAAASFLAASGFGARGPAETRARLSGARVWALGGAAVAAETARLLRLSGVGTVGAVAGVDDVPAESTLVVVAPSPREQALAARWNDVALARGVPWLQVLPFDGRLVAIGPVYLPGETACYECFRLRRAGNAAYGGDFERLESAPIAATAPPSLDAAVAGIAATLALRRLASQDPFALGTVYALEHGETISLSVHRVYRVPRCAACSEASRVSAPSPWGEFRDAA